VYVILPRSFYRRNTITVARDLLGKILVHGAARARIVETEAYLGGDDLAAHSARGLTERTQVIFGPPGHAYVYLIYGMHECLNLVAEREGSPGCVLIRALEPLEGIDEMRARRRMVRNMEDLARGPGNLTKALGITRAHNGVDVTRGELRVEHADDTAPLEIITTPRIGITKCADLPLRFFVAGNRCVSGPRTMRR
jgi:DNA-3-methyladenine glycosylase